MSDGSRSAAGKQFVLVHGMSHGAWAWELLTPRLERLGHRTLTLDLPGHGRRAHERHRASVDGYARAVADAMIQAGIDRATLVGHSMGGVVIQRAAELVTARIAHLVFLAAVVVPSGKRLIDVQIAPAAQALMLGSAAAGGGVIQYPAAMEHARWINDLPPGDARVVAALSRMTPQPLRPWMERVDLRTFFASRLPRTYVRCLRDNAVTPARAAGFAARLGVTPIDLESDHEPMLTAVDELAALLDKLEP